MTDGPGGLGFDLSPTPQPEPSETAKRIQAVDPAGFAAELEKVKALGPLSSASYDYAASMWTTKNLGALAKEYDVSRGVQADVSRVNPKYLAELEARGVDHSTIIEFAKRARPDLSPSAAIAWWSAKAGKMQNADIRYGAEESED